MEHNPSDNKAREGLWHLMSGDGTPTDRANTRVLNAWSLAWAAAILLAASLLKFTHLPAALQWLIVLAPNVVAFVVLHRYLRFLRMTDELLRRIHLEGLAVGFGFGYLFSIGYLIAEGAGAPPVSLSALVLVMTIGWMGGNLMALRRYK